MAFTASPIGWILKEEIVWKINIKTKKYLNQYFHPTVLAPPLCIFSYDEIQSTQRMWEKSSKLSGKCSCKFTQFSSYGNGFTVDATWGCFYFPSSSSYFFYYYFKLSTLLCVKKNLPEWLSVQTWSKMLSSFKWKGFSLYSTPIQSNQLRYFVIIFTTCLLFSITHP